MRLIALAVLSLNILGGCAFSSSRVAVKPMKAQDSKQLASDSEACEGWARTQEQAARSYSACMMSRGYAATVELEAYIVDMTGPSGADPATMVMQIRQCFDLARQKRGDAGHAAAVGVSLLGGTMAAAAYRGSLLEEPFGACMVPLGYTVKQWVPER
jgi:hypothetical protein